MFGPAVTRFVPPSYLPEVAATHTETRIIKGMWSSGSGMSRSRSRGLDSERARSKDNAWRGACGGRREWWASASPPSCTPQDLPEQTIGASYGDALLAARSVGLAKPHTDWSSISETVEPKAENREIYDELYRIYRGPYPATREASHALADLQRGEIGRASCRAR